MRTDAGIAEQSRDYATADSVFFEPFESDFFSDDPPSGFDSDFDSLLVSVF